MFAGRGGQGEGKLGGLEYGCDNELRAGLFVLFTEHRIVFIYQVLTGECDHRLISSARVGSLWTIKSTLEVVIPYTEIP